METAVTIIGKDRKTSYFHVVETFMIFNDDVTALNISII